MERVVTSIENLEGEIAEIKTSLIPDGTHRILELEKEVKTLAKFKNGLAAVGTLAVILLPFSSEIFK